MKLHYVVVHGVEFPRRKKRSVLAAVALSPKEAAGILASYTVTGRKAEVVREDELKEVWLGPGGKLALKKLLTDKVEELRTTSETAESAGESERLLRIAGQVEAHRDILVGRGIL